MAHGDLGKMTDVEIVQEFGRLIEVAEKKWRATYSADDLEPELLNILIFTKHNLDSKGVLEQCFLDLIYTKKWRVSLDVLEFCMHELKWSKIKQALEKVVENTNDIRERDALSGVIEAFSDDWNGAVIYNYYSEP